MRSLPYVAATDAGTLYIDVCNGDADGLCAIRQLRLAEPREAVLVTGLKREIGLLARVSPRPGLVVDVCDIALERNRDALAALLAAGARVRYFDHHLPGPLPAHPALELHIDTASDRCTSAIVTPSASKLFPPLSERLHNDPYEIFRHICSTRAVWLVALPIHPWYFQLYEGRLSQAVFFSQTS